MDILKVAALALTGVILSLLVKDFRGGYSIYIALIIGILIFLYMGDYLQKAIDLLRSLTDNTGLGSGSVGILFKVLGIAYLTEFSAQLCKDAGVAALGMKVELAGKLMILVSAIPVFTSLADLILSLLQ